MSKQVVHIIKQVICTEGAEKPWRRWPQTASCVQFGVAQVCVRLWSRLYK